MADKSDPAEVAWALALARGHSGNLEESKHGQKTSTQMLEYQIRRLESRNDACTNERHNPNSTSAGQEIRKAVTVVEAPP